MNDLRSNFGSRIAIQKRKFLLAAAWLIFPVFHLGISLGQSQPHALNQTNNAVIIEIHPSLSPAGLTAVTRQIDEALEKNCQTIVFEFSDRGLSFEGFRDLAQKIIDLSKNKNIRTVAYIPKEAKQMNLLAVYACRDIIANELAQLGQVIPPMRLPDPSVPRINYDEQSVLNLIEELARLTNRNSLLARAMTQRATTLTEIRRQGKSETELVDQTGMSELSKPHSPPWEKVRTWVDSGSVLLLTGSQAKKLKLVTDLASSRENLANILGVTLLELDSAQKTAARDDPNQPKTKDRPDPAAGKTPKAVIITIAEMIDPGLVDSLIRRTEFAIDQGATIIIYEMDTFGGRVDSAIEIYDYFLKDVGRRARTVAYIPTKAISAGAMISVACHDIIMKRNTQIGDCAPIQMGGSIENTEREKIETILRTYFRDAARENGYPEALCQAMVSATLEVWRVKNLEDDTYGYFFTSELNHKEYPWDLQNKVLVCEEDKLLTLTHQEALNYGVARTIVEGTHEQALEQAISFLEKRYEIEIPRPVARMAAPSSPAFCLWSLCWPSTSS